MQQFISLVFTLLFISSCNGLNAHLSTGSNLTVALPESLWIDGPVVFKGSCPVDGEDITVTVKGADPENVGPCPCWGNLYTCPEVIYKHLPMNVNVSASNGATTTVNPRNPGDADVPVNSYVSIDSTTVEVGVAVSFTGSCSPNSLGSISLSIDGAVPNTVGACDCIQSKYSCPATTFTSLPSDVDVVAVNSQGYNGPSIDTTQMNVSSAVALTGPLNLAPGVNSLTGSCAPDAVGSITFSLSGADHESITPCDCSNSTFSCDVNITNSSDTVVITSSNSAGVNGPSTSNLTPSLPSLVDLTSPGNITIGENTTLSGSCFPSGSNVSVTIGDATPSSVGPCSCVSGSFSCDPVSFSELPVAPKFVATYGSASDSESVLANSSVDLLNPGTINTIDPVALTGSCAHDGTDNISITLASGYTPTTAGPCSCVSGSFSCSPITFSVIASDPPTITASETSGNGGPSTDSEIPVVGPQIIAVNDLLDGVYLGDSGSQNVSTNDTSRNCAPITYSISNESGVAVTGTAPNYIVTPSVLGAWSFDYTATCSDGVTSDTGTSSGTALAPADLVTSIAVDDSNPGEGQTLTYTISVVNNGAGDATNVSVTDLCPLGTSYSGSTPGVGSYDSASGLWSIGNLASPNAVALDLKCTVTALVGELVTNTTSAASADQFDPTTVGDSLSADFSVIAEIDLQTPSTFPSGPGLPLIGSCSPAGVDNINISAPSMSPSPITCSCVSGSILCPSNVAFDGTVDEPLVTAVLTYAAGSVSDSETIVMSALADVFGPYNGWYSEDGTAGLCFKGIDNKVYCWGDKTGGVGSSEYPALMNIPDTYYLVATESNAFTITTDGKLYGWGYDDTGYSGPGYGSAIVGYNEPAIVAGPGEAWDGDNRSIVHFSGDHTDVCAVLDNGELWTWGVNSYGELGIGEEDIKKPIPVQAFDPANPTTGNYVTNAKRAFCAGSTHCYDDEDGKIYCSGANTYGQLGQGTGSTTKSLVFLEVPGITNAIDVAIESWAITVAVCALKSTDNTVWCWGQGKAAGDLNTDTPTQWVDASSNPITGITKIRSGHHHTCGLKSDGTVWCQGVNDSGQLGDGTYNNSRYTVIQVPGINDAVDLSVGREHSCVLRSNDTIYCWGSNTTDWAYETDSEVNGQTGNLDVAHNPSPVQFMPDLGPVFKSMKAFAFDTCGLLYSGEIYCMGLNPGTANEGVDPVGNFITPQPTVPTANLVALVSQDQDNYIEGDEITYSVELRNLGPDTATNITGTTSCPSGTTFVSASTSLGSFDSSLGQWSVASILNFESEVLTLKCSVDQGITIGGLTTSLNMTSTLTENDPSIGGGNVPFETFVAYIPAVQCGSDYTGITSYKAAGDGTSEETAYEIGNVDTYNNYLSSGIDRDKHLILCDNLDFSSLINPASLGTFTGHLNGNGNTISNFSSVNGFIYYLRTEGSLKNITFENLSINCTGKNFCGLVERIDDATLDGINITGTSSVVSDKAYVGSILGYGTGLSDYLNITSNADVTSTIRTDNAGKTGYVGGVFGYLSAEELLVKDISYTGNVTSDANYLGGIAGRIHFKLAPGSIDDLSNTGVVTYSDNSGATGSYIGGLVGVLSAASGSGKGTLSNSSFSGDVIATETKANYVGGLFGYVDGIDESNYVEVSESDVLAGASISCHGPLTTSYYCGGLSGGFNDFSHLIDSTSAASVDGDKFVGGLIGYLADNGSVESSEATGDVTCNLGYCGGLIGYSLKMNTVENSLASGDVTYLGTSETNAYFGGLIGAATQGAHIIDSSYEGDHVLGARHTAGLVGYFQASNEIHLSSISNSYVEAQSVSTIDGTDNYLNASGFIGLADIRYITMDLTNSFSSVDSIQGSRSIGGFIFDVSMNNGATFNISNSFATGSASFKTSNPNNYQFGGFLGELAWTNVDSNLNVSDSYTTVSIDTTGMNQDSGNSALGGFVAYKSRSNSTFTNVYENTGSILDGKTTARYSGGFIGYDLSTASYSTDLTNSFTTSSVKDVTHGGDFMFGKLSSGTTPSIVNSFYLGTTICLGGTPCDGSNGGVSTTLTNLQVLQTSPNTPLGGWDFVDVWSEIVGDYPVLHCPSGASTDFCDAWDGAQ